MFQHKPSRFRRRPNGRSHRQHSAVPDQNRLRPNLFSNGQTKNNFRQTMSAEKLFEKYSTLAKEAMSSGDKTLSENYLQHADHFVRVIEDKNKNRNLNKKNVTEKSTDIKNKLSDTSPNKDSVEIIKDTVENNKN